MATDFGGALGSGVGDIRRDPPRRP